MTFVVAPPHPSPISTSLDPSTTTFLHTKFPFIYLLISTRALPLLQLHPCPNSPSIVLPPPYPCTKPRTVHSSSTSYLHTFQPSPLFSSIIFIIAYPNHAKLTSTLIHLLCTRYLLFLLLLMHSTSPLHHFHLKTPKTLNLNNLSFPSLRSFLVFLPLPNSSTPFFSSHPPY